MSKHIKFINQLPCSTCQALPPSEASHIRLGADGGMGLKPSDKFIIPQCHECHMRLHRGEATFFGQLLGEAHIFAHSLFKVSGDWGEGVRLTLEFRRKFI